MTKKFKLLLTVMSVGICGIFPIKIGAVEKNLGFQNGHVAPPFRTLIDEEE